MCRSPEVQRLGGEQDKGASGGAVVLQFLTGAVVTQVSSLCDCQLHAAYL